MDRGSRAGSIRSRAQSSADYRKVAGDYLTFKLEAKLYELEES